MRIRNHKHPIRSVRVNPPRGRGFRAAGTAVLAALAAAVCLGPGPTQAHTAQSSPIATWVDDMIDDLDDLEDEAKAAADVIGLKDGPLDEPDRSAVDAALDMMLAIVRDIQDPGWYPSLDPPDAGTIDKTVNPSSLPDYAQSCLALAQDARDAMDAPVIDDEAIGTYLKTIEYLITRAQPHNYRSRAGIG